MGWKPGKYTEAPDMQEVCQAPLIRHQGQAEQRRTGLSAVLQALETTGSGLQDQESGQKGRSKVPSKSVDRC